MGLVCQESHGIPGNGVDGMTRRWFSRLIIFVYVVVGGFVAWDHGYINLAWLRTLGSALLAILLWWLILLGVNLHIHA
jgi:hypothetical protein